MLSAIVRATFKGSHKIGGGARLTAFDDFFSKNECVFSSAIEKEGNYTYHSHAAAQEVEVLVNKSALKNFHTFFICLQ